MRVRRRHEHGLSPEFPSPSHEEETFDTCSSRWLFRVASPSSVGAIRSKPDRRLSLLRRRGSNARPRCSAVVRAQFGTVPTVPSTGRQAYRVYKSMFPREPSLVRSAAQFPSVVSHLVAWGPE